eukprot:1138757-Pelagomonas_calceolata.AAC.4
MLSRGRVEGAFLNPRGGGLHVGPYPHLSKQLCRNRIGAGSRQLLQRLLTKEFAAPAQTWEMRDGKGCYLSHEEAVGRKRHTGAEALEYA